MRPTTAPPIALALAVLFSSPGELWAQTPITIDVPAVVVPDWLDIDPNATSPMVLPYDGDTFRDDDGAIIQRGPNWYITSDSDGVLGTVEMPAEIRWAASVNRAVFAVDVQGRVYRALTWDDALTGRFDELATMPGASVFDASSKYVVGASGTKVFHVNTGSGAVSESEVAPAGKSIVGVWTRADGVTVVRLDPGEGINLGTSGIGDTSFGHGGIGESGIGNGSGTGTSDSLAESLGESDTPSGEGLSQILIQRKPGKKWVEASIPGVRLRRTGQWIHARHQLVVLAKDGKTWTADLDADVYKTYPNGHFGLKSPSSFDVGLASTPLGRVVDPAVGLHSPAAPKSKVSASVEESADSFGGMLGMLGSGECTGTDCVARRPPQRHYASTRVAFLTDGRCVGGEPTTFCDELSTLPHIVSVSSSGLGAIESVPEDCDPVRLGSALGLGVLLCRESSGAVTVRTRAATSRVWRPEGALVGFSESAQLHAGVDGTIAYTLCPSTAVQLALGEGQDEPVSTCTSWVRSPSASGEADAWQSYSGPDEIAHTLLPGGEVLAVTSDGDKSRFGLRHHRAGGAQYDLATGFSLGAEGLYEVGVEDGCLQAVAGRRDFRLSRDSNGREDGTRTVVVTTDGLNNGSCDSVRAAAAAAGSTADNTHHATPADEGSDPASDAQAETEIESSPPVADAAAYGGAALIDGGTPLSLRAELGAYLVEGLFRVHALFRWSDTATGDAMAGGLGAGVWIDMGGWRMGYGGILGWGSTAPLDEESTEEPPTGFLYGFDMHLGVTIAGPIELRALLSVILAPAVAVDAQGGLAMMF